jgi:hypothetical protein
LPGVCFSPPRVPRFQSRHTSTPFNSASDAFELHPDVRSYGPSTLREGRGWSYRKDEGDDVDRSGFDYLVSGADRVDGFEVLDAIEGFGGLVIDLAARPLPLRVTKRPKIWLHARSAEARSGER